MRPAFNLLFISIAALALTGFGDPAYFANQRGNEKYNEQKYDEALKEYLDAQSGEPEEKSIDYNLGGAYYKMGRYGEAARAYERAMSSENENIQRKAEFNLGAAHYKAGDKSAASGKTDGAIKSYTESAKLYKSLLKKDNADNDARHNLELALLKIKEMDQKKKQGQEQKQQQDNKGEQEKDQDKHSDKSDEERQKQSEQDKSDKDKTSSDDKKEDNANSGQGDDNNQASKAQNEQKPGDYPRPGQITREQAERILDAIERDEIKLKENIRKGRLKKLPTSGRDW